MPGWIELFRWWILDEGSGERRLTPYKLSRADAQRAFPGAVPDTDSREVRWRRRDSDVPESDRPAA
jgi:hypothetical protein